MGKLLVYVKEPMHKAKHVWMSFSQDNLERVLDGKPVAYPFSTDEQVLAADDMIEGDKYYNCTFLGQQFFGTIIICGKDANGNPASSTMEMKTFKQLFPELMREE